MSSVKIVSKDLIGNEVVCFVKRPSPKETTEAKIYANILASRLLNTKDVNGKPAVILRSQVDDHLRSLGVWSDQDEANIKTISNQISAKERILASGGTKGTTKEQAKNIAKEVIELRDKQTKIFAKRRELDRLTLESQTEQANFDSLLTSCLQDESGNRIFSNVEAYQERVDEPFAYDAAVELSKIVFSTSEDYRKSLPEYKFLVKYGFMNEEFQWIDKDKNFIDPDTGNRINKDGRFINEKGELVDVEGLLVDEDGNPVEEFVEFVDA
jgi:hypothetical protein